MTVEADLQVGLSIHPLEAPMYRMKFVVAAAMAALSVSILAQAPAGVTVFEGARVIVGDGRAPIENATFIVTGNRITRSAAPADVAFLRARRASTSPARP